MSVQRERQVFDPDSIRVALKADLPNGLRALADAIESGEIDGTLLSVQGCGLLTNWRDDRAHIRVSFDVAAQVFRWFEGQKLPMREPHTIALPAVSAYALTKGTE